MYAVPGINLSGGGRTPGTTGTPVATQLHTAFLQGACLDVEQEVLWLLDTTHVLISAGSVRDPAEERPACPSR